MINFYIHSGSGNHGCEAIVRASSEILKEKICLYSVHPEQDKLYGIDDICKIEQDDYVFYPRFGLKWLCVAIHKRLTGKGDLALKFIRRNLLKDIKKDEVYCSIGGDNYCYPGTEDLASINRIIKKKGARTVLWGCSVEPELLKQDEIKRDMQQFDLITARETISYNALVKINSNTILVADPAFALPKVDLPLPSGWIEGNMIGINASPLILDNGKSGELVFEAYRQLIHCILEKTDCGIALIPHVVWENNDDRKILEKLYNSIEAKDRMILLNDANCMELKGFISRCRMFIGARTHATIAAYSTHVPTLVLGYSVKSKGIAKDLFGTDEKYVLPVQNIKDINELADGFIWLMKNEEEIRNHLKCVMPEYVSRTKAANEAVKKLL